jgi:hypothetical protein
MFITGTCSIALGIKDRPTHLPGSSYIHKLRWMEHKYVVMWDDEEKRGWLVNGTSALLHLVRADLHFTAHGNFASELVFDAKSMGESGNNRRPNSAVEVLKSAHNRRLEVYQGDVQMIKEEENKWKAGEPDDVETIIIQKWKTGAYLFQDLVVHHYEILEKLVQVQEDISGRNGIKIKPRIRKHLEGWDFVDIAKGRDVQPRVATLSMLGWGWVDFIRSIRALVLVGCGFGNLILPTDPDALCSPWRKVPSGQCFLAVTVHDLNQIHEVYGSSRTEPPEHVHGLVWHCPGSTTANCNQCRSSRQNGTKLKTLKSHVDPVQVFYSSLSRPRILHRNIKRTVVDDPNAAVIFGHNLTWPYKWKDDGNDASLEHLPASRETPGDNAIAIIVDQTVNAFASSSSSPQASGTSTDLNGALQGHDTFSMTHTSISATGDSTRGQQAVSTWNSPGDPSSLAIEAPRASHAPPKRRKKEMRGFMKKIAKFIDLPPWKRNR